MTRYVLRDNRTGKYFACGATTGDGFTATRIKDAIICGECDRSPQDAPHEDWTAIDVRLDDDGRAIGPQDT